MKTNPKKIAMEKVLDILQSQLKEINRKVNSNLWQFQRLTEEQTVLKRERAELGKIISDLQSKKDKTDPKKVAG